MSNQSQKIADRREALKKEIERTATLEKFDRLTGEIAEVLTDLGVSSNDRTKTLRPLWDFLAAQLAREPHLPGVEYIRAGEEVGR